MSDHQPVRFGLVGAGGIAQAYAAAFRETANAILVAVADVRTEAATAIAETLNCPSFATHTEMLRETDLDAVIICTPPVTHREICIDFCNAGVNVLCEKPLSVDSDSAKEMLQAATANSVKLSMASKFRYVDDVIRAKSIVESGILGDLVLFENTFTAHVDMSQRWNARPEISGGGVLIDNGTHSVDILRYFLGPLRDLQAIEGKRVQQLPVEDTVRLFVRSQSGVMGNIDLSWSINKEQPSFINIYGTHGTVQVGWRESRYRRASDDEWIVFGNGYNKVAAFRGQIESFARSVRGEDQLIVSADDAMASVEVIEAAYRSLQQSQWEPVLSHATDDAACVAG